MCTYFYLKYYTESFFHRNECQLDNFLDKHKDIDYTKNIPQFMIDIGPLYEQQKHHLKYYVEEKMLYTLDDIFVFTDMSTKSYTLSDENMDLCCLHLKSFYMEFINNKNKVPEVYVERKFYYPTLTEIWESRFVEKVKIYNAQIDQLIKDGVINVKEMEELTKNDEEDERKEKEREDEIEKEREEERKKKEKAERKKERERKKEKEKERAKERVKEKIKAKEKVKMKENINDGENEINNEINDEINEETDDDIDNEIGNEINNNHNKNNNNNNNNNYNNSKHQLVKNNVKKVLRT